MGKQKRIEKPKIRHMASLWSLTGYGGKKGEWTVDEKMARIKKAGFDGFLGRVPVVTSELVAKHGLIFAATVDMGLAKEVKPKLKAIQAAGARCVNVQMLDHDTPTKRAVSLARRIMNTAEDLEMDVAIEVHRDTCTETPEKAYALAAGFEKAEKKLLKMTFDFSHPAVIKHLAPSNYWPRLAERVDLIQLAQQFHFRPFNGHHAQIPACNGKGGLTPEFLDWLPFAEQVIETWLGVAGSGREMFVCPEQGPPGYFLSVFPDRWKDVQTIRDEVDKLWRRQVRKWKGTA
ncbi:MAG: sugar phosphate isomerase/epimerase [Candidatus Latescibacteria bacterium]|nr:sugar phosphate isomerase/epimerase [Candidatus Latescibacterota bacterium]MBT4139698.1 sugar phosphate isomerase/epimerase [Candidatus Latescibacterota bacterium]